MQQQLAPIWDAIDDEQWLYALQLVEKLQKRYRNPNKTLLGLQGLCLAKEGRTTEAIATCENIRTLAPKVGDTYQTIHDVLKSSPNQKSSEYLLSAMETGFKEIQSEFMGRLWFMEAVRTGHLVAQRKAAVELQKGFLSRDYFYLLVMSMYLLYCRTSEGKERQLQGMLLYRMITKAAANNPDNSTISGNHNGQSSSAGPSIETVEEFYVYIDVMRTLGKTQELIVTLEGSLGSKYATNHDLILLRIELLAEVHGTTSTQVRNFCEEHLQSGIDDWLVYRSYIDSCACKSEVARFLDTIAADKLSRNNALAAVYLHANDSSQSDLLDSLMRYCQLFSAKLATFEDLAPYVKTLDDSSATTFLSSVGGIACSKQIDEVLRDTNVAKFSLLLQSVSMIKGLESNRADLINFSLSRYKTSLDLGHDLKDTDNQYGDDLLLTAVHTILGTNGASSQALIQNIILLEYAMRKSKHNFQIKLHLVYLYRKLAAWSQARKYFVSLGVKQVQQDTLSYLLMEDSVYEYVSTMQITALKESQNIYYANQVETPDMTCQAYEHGTYSKVSEFLKFRERLENSIWRIESGLNTQSLQVLLDKFDWSSDIPTAVLQQQLYDNKSRHVMLDIDAAANPPLEQENNASDRDLVRLKATTRKLQMMQAIVQKNEALLTIDNTTSEDQPCKLVELLYAAKFSDFSETQTTEFFGSLNIPATNAATYTAEALKQYGTLVEVVKCYAVLRPHISLVKSMDRRVLALSGDLQTAIDTLRRELLTTTFVPMSEIDVTLDGLDEVSTSVMKGVRTAQSEGLTCLLGVLKSIKI